MTRQRLLQCRAKDVRYDFDRKTGMLVMAAGDCCDMSGCISLFENIDPDVERIRTVSGAEEDTSYFRSEFGWVARHPKIGLGPIDFLEVAKKP